jgi:hypothetical protein
LRRRRKFIAIPIAYKLLISFELTAGRAAVAAAAVIPNTFRS